MITFAGVSLRALWFTSAVPALAVRLTATQTAAERPQEPGPEECCQVRGSAACVQFL